jgi:hypothetical protein
MKEKLLFSAFILSIVLFLFNSGVAQQDPNDPGQADTLYFVAGPPCSSDGDTLYFPSAGGDVTIYINFWNDEGLAALVAPLIDTTYGPPSNAFLDSAKNNGAIRPLCFQGSRIQDFSFTGCFLDSNPPQVLYGAIQYGVPDSLLPGEGLFATAVYTVSDTGRICLDTLLFPPNNFLAFVRPDAVAFTPQFVSRCFYLASYLRGDTNGDNSVTFRDVLYLIRYLFLNGPAPVYPSDVNCDGKVDGVDVYYLIRYLIRGEPPPGDPDNDGVPDC